MPQNEYLLAKSGFITAENERSIFWQNLLECCQILAEVPHCRAFLVAAAAQPAAQPALLQHVCNHKSPAGADQSSAHARLRASSYETIGEGQTRHTPAPDT
jgi:hypothetical protein